MNSRHIRWLYGQLPALVDAGLVPPSVADALRYHYGQPGDRFGRATAMAVFGVVGAVLVSLGIIVFLGHNWDQLPRWARLASALVPLAASQVMCLWVLARRAKSPAWREGGSMAVSLLAAASVAVVGQAYNVPGEMPEFLLAWAGLTLPLAYVMQTVLPAVLFLALILVRATSGYHDWITLQSFWLLALAALPLVWDRLRRDRFSPGSLALCWTMGASLLIHPMFLSHRALPGAWAAAMAGAACVLLLSGLMFMDRTDGPASLWKRPLHVLGGTSCMILALILSHSEAWDGISRQVFRFESWSQASPAVWAAGAETVALALAGLVLLAMASRRVAGTGRVPATSRVSATSRVPAMVLPLALAGIAASWTGAPDWIPAAGFSLFLLYMAVALINQGLKDGQLLSLNKGLTILALVVMMRFFEDWNFLARGTAFIVVGMLFLGLNLAFSRKFRAGS